MVRSNRLSISELEGFEYDWLGVDSAGFVGFFSTAGCGAPPMALADDFASYNDGVAEMSALSKVGPARCCPEVAEDAVYIWRTMAERGIYAFDSTPLGGPYRLRCAPITPMLLHTFSPAIQALCSRVRFPELNFSDREAIDAID